MSFLRAEWRKLVIFNYEVDPQLLRDEIPYGTELDLWKGKCYVSVVGFMFLNTKLLGVKIPFHVNFEEVNLRFYVKRKVNDQWRRGVVFIKEIVPKPALTFVANTVYHENYVTLPMDHRWAQTEQLREVQYRWKLKDTWQSIQVTADINPSEILLDSQAEFITEHYWGYARINDKKSNEYEVTHPRWLQYHVKDYKIDIDFAKNYGSRFKDLEQNNPTSVMLAEGSRVTVENKTTIK